MKTEFEFTNVKLFNENITKKNDNNRLYEEYIVNKKVKCILIQLHISKYSTKSGECWRECVQKYQNIGKL